ncbi:MAG: LysE family transporter [Methanosarcina sp.]|nr:LysE family transporter [Methanosarcina sp.]MDD4522070.1 LysE family transporter [Methanosarcina sp.]
MIELAKALILGFTVGISAAIIPGPMMFAAIAASIKNGWRAGPLIFIGHALVELAIFVVILIGASSFLGETVITYLAIIGGLIMLLSGLVMIKSAKETSTMEIPISVSGLNSSSGSARIITSVLKLFSGPVSAGIITSALNPFFVIWWLTAGSAIVLQEYLIGISVVTAFLLGHWIADFGFLVAVSSSFSQGNRVLSQRTHEIMVYLCGGFMAFFGLWFIIYNSSIAAMI